MAEEEAITVTILVKDAQCIVLGPLEYAVRCVAGDVEEGASPMRVRQELAKALEAAGHLTDA